MVSLSCRSSLPFHGDAASRKNTLPKGIDFGSKRDGISLLGTSTLISAKARAIFGPPVFVPPPVYSLLVLTFGAALVAEGARLQPTGIAFLRLLAAGAFLCGFVLILFLLYIQWTGVGEPIIQGFYGRYLFPLLPPLLILLPFRQFTFFGIQARAWVILLAIVSLTSTLGLTWMTYWV